MIVSEGVVEHETTFASSSLSLPGLIGFYFGLRVCLTFLFFRADPTAGAKVSFGLNLLLLFPVALYAAGRPSISCREALATPPFRLVLAFLALALASLAWSETSSPAVALGYWAAMAADVALTVALLRSEHPARVSASLLKGYVGGVCLLALIAWAAPTLPDLRIGDDEFLNPNAIGFECAFGALICQHFTPEGARWKWIGGVLVLTLLRSLSKTSIIAFAVVEGLYLVRSRRIRRSVKLALAAGALILVAAFWNLFSAYYAFYSNNSTQAETLSGRLGIWIVTLGFALQEPWFGHGLHSFRTVIPDFGGFEPWHAHNELLQQFFAYGLAGIVLVTSLYWSLFAQARRLRSHPFATLTLLLLLLVLVRGLADTERFDLSFPLWAISAISLTLARTGEPTR